MVAEIHTILKTEGVSFCLIRTIDLPFLPTKGLIIKLPLKSAEKGSAVLDSSVDEIWYEEDPQRLTVWCKCQEQDLAWREVVVEIAKQDSRWTVE